ncbi:MAG: deoxyribodipyrimidine photo-lyase [Motiliproteus sp.]|nr:deoxyribodipyrimidine photo-lyase [Motiliproteus sp.]MCW9053783.1 deoxyribodipyrimidine photo-lyase [Motiliproteus sp.]
MQLVWFRNDLRVRDNPALYSACLRKDAVVAVVALTPEQWKLHDESSSRVSFWLANLRDLQQCLAKLNIPLRLLRVDDFQALPGAIVKLAQELKVTDVHFNREYPLNESLRDGKVAALLQPLGISVSRYHADLIIPPERVATQQGQPYRVFTPFSRAWKTQLQILDGDPLPIPLKQTPCPVVSDSIPDDIDYHVGVSTCNLDVWPAGAEMGHRRLAHFMEQGIAGYGVKRDMPAMDGTSSLSPYLSVGALSARQCLAALRQTLEPGNWLDHPWLNELIWREFYRHLLVHFPDLNRCKPFRPQVEERIQWRDDPDLFDAWCHGETGFAIVDAGMKQLRQTGWMHNRLRMVTASFLTKLLRQDWRKGEHFFMQNLIDGDFASNLGGWQWSASVGADAAPYFRIFNPQRQAERFDPSGDFVAYWLPELAAITGKKRHDADAGFSLGRPAPIIDYQIARQLSLALYNAA